MLVIVLWLIRGFVALSSGSLAELLDDASAREPVRPPPRGVRCVACRCPHAIRYGWPGGCLDGRAFYVDSGFGFTLTRFAAVLSSAQSAVPG